MTIPYKTKIVNNYSGHSFGEGEEVTIFREFPSGLLDAMAVNGDCEVLYYKDILNIKQMKQMTDAVLDTAKRLCKAQNRVTTLEIKTEVMKTHPTHFWTQAFVSATMDTAFQNGDFTYVDTQSGPNLHRIYSVTSPVPVSVAPVGAWDNKTPKKTVKTMKTTKKVATVVAPKTKSISKAKALELMENNRGHFFTATTVTKDGEIRIMNCQYLKDQSQSKLGYVRVKENILSKKLKNGDKSLKKSETGIRTINMQTLLELKIAGASYKVK